MLNNIFLLDNIYIRGLDGYMELIMMKLILTILIHLEHLINFSQGELN